MKINKFILPNGLRVIHHENPQSALVVVNTLYDVGSKDEDPQHTGFAHLFEHLMFGGSVNAPSFDEPIQNSGGENNAWTSVDYTNYYVVLPANNVEIAFWLESDRMLSLDFNSKSLDVQCHVVCEEFKQRCLNQPYGDISHLLRPMLFKEHPYQWPTIGKELSHIEDASLEQVKEFFFSHYAPNNAILSVVGNITLQKCKELVEKWYGDIPARKINKRQLPKEPQQTELRLLEVERDVPTNLIYIVFHTPDRLSSDFYISDIISDILANGNSARLYQRLVKRDKLFVNVNAYVSGDIEEGLFYLTGYLAEGVDFDTAQKALWKEIEILQQERVEESELEKLKNKFESTFLLNNMDLMNLASNLAFYELLGDVNLINEEVAKYRSLTAEKIQTFAQKVFTKENSSILYYKKKNE